MKRITLIIIALSIPILLILNLTFGSVSIPFEDIIGVLTNNPETDKVYTSIIMHTRLPQAITAIACGAGLSVAGLIMQTIFRNPLAGPSVLGISSAASLGVALIVLMAGIAGIGNIGFGLIGNTSMTLAAIIAALATMLIIVNLSKRVKGNATLLIAGVMIGYISSAITGILKYFSTEEAVHSYVIWGLGSFSRVTGGQVYLFFILIMLIMPISLLLCKGLNLLLLGDKYAASLGLNVRVVRSQAIIIAGVLTAIITAYCGPIMFIGLAVPHICRNLLRTSDHHILIPGTMLCGASLAMACNLIARLPGFDGALPINSVTALIGAPIALKVLLTRNKHRE